MARKAILNCEHTQYDEKLVVWNFPLGENTELRVCYRCGAVMRDAFIQDIIQKSAAFAAVMVKQSTDPKVAEKGIIKSK